MKGSASGMVSCSSDCLLGFSKSVYQNGDGKVVTHGVKGDGLPLSKHDFLTTHGKACILLELIRTCG